ncbi:MAG: carboxypeptidase regulatory-like domain-containing protein [Candidatus Eisenbacteria sp.]|nr:carboxypeptidase regulatory-like domain-containing protein [Candidatus Eisenbacteria bacterium]
MNMRVTRTAVPLGMVLLLLSTNCDSVFAPDDGKLRGRVVNDTGEAVVGARVETDPFRGYEITGPGGEFAFNGLAADSYTLLVSQPGYDNGSGRASLPKSGGLSCATPEGAAANIVLTLEGWGSYDEADLGRAASQFLVAVEENPACADARNGLGWTYARFDSLESAVESFEAALALDGEFLDAFTGLALVSSALNEHDEAIAAAIAVLDAAGDAYVFRRDESITSADLRLVLAQSYFYTSQYALAQEQVDLLDPGNGLDSGEPDTWWVEGVHYPTYEEALLAEIQIIG